MLGLNPCFTLAVLSYGILALWFPVRPVEIELDLKRPVRIRGWIARAPELRNDFLTFELAPLTVHQDDRLFEVEGRIMVTVTSSLRLPEDYFSPPLRWGEVVSFTSRVRKPSYHAIPGTADRRLLYAAKGIPFRTSLKSPRQLLRHGFHPKVRFARPLFSYLESFENACSASLDKHTSALVFSALLGRKGLLPPEVRKRINRLGITHLFAVSGFHLGIVAAFVYFATARFGPFRSAATLSAVWFYVLLAGFPVSAIRAGVFVTVFLSGVQLGHRARLLNTLGVSALVLVAFWRSSLFLPSFHFSFGCLLGITWLGIPWILSIRPAYTGLRELFSGPVRTGFSTPARRSRKTRYALEHLFGFIPQTAIRRALRLAAPPLFYCSSIGLMTTSIQLFLFPISIYYTNNWSFLHLFANFLFIPLFTLLVPLVLVSVVLFHSPLGPLSLGALDQYSGFLLWLLERLSPASDPYYFPQPAAMEILLFYGLVATGLFLKSRSRRFLFLLAVALIVFSLTREHREPGPLQITMLDVGQAESIHLRYPNGEQGLIDAGSPIFPESMIEVSERLISRYLWVERIGYLDRVFLTHPERDHIGAFPFLARVFRPVEFFYSRRHVSYPGRGNRIGAGWLFVRGGIVHEVIHPEISRADQMSPNDASLVLLIHYGRFSALFTGDVGSGVEKRLASRIGPVVLLKVAHHGAGSSTPGILLKSAGPEIAWISAGRDNPFGHPSSKVLERLRDADVRTFSTKEWGTLRIETDGATWRMQSYSLQEGSFVDRIGPSSIDECTAVAPELE